MTFLKKYLLRKSREYREHKEPDRSIDKILKEVGVNNLHELEDKLDKLTIKRLFQLLDPHLETARVTKISTIACFPYSEEKLEFARQSIKAGISAGLNESHFSSETDYITMYQVSTDLNEHFVVARLLPYEPYQKDNLLWFFRLPRMLDDSDMRNFFKK